MATALIFHPSVSHANDSPIDLGSAESFAVLAGAAITNTGGTSLSGTAGADIGSYPTPTYTGHSLVTTTGTEYYTAQPIVAEAQVDLTAAFTNGMSRAPTETIAADLGGRTLTSGVYNSTSTILLSGALTLDGQGDAGSTFIFQAGSALTTMSGSNIVLTNGAQACNVFWVVGSSATLGTGSHFVGTVMALESITNTTNASVEGRLLARNGTVTLDSNTIVNNACVEPASAGPGDDSSDSAGDDSGDSAGDDSSHSAGDATEETPGEDSPAPAPAPGEGTVDGGVLPNTGGIEWLVVAVAGLALAAAGTVAYLRLGRGRHGRP